MIEHAELLELDGEHTIELSDILEGSESLLPVVVDEAEPPAEPRRLRGVIGAGVLFGLVIGFGTRALLGLPNPAAASALHAAPSLGPHAFETAAHVMDAHAATDDEAVDETEAFTTVDAVTAKATRTEALTTGDAVTAKATRKARARRARRPRAARKVVAPSAAADIYAELEPNGRGKDRDSRRNHVRRPPRPKTDLYETDLPPLD